MEDVNKRRLISFSLSKLECGPQEINSWEIRVHLEKTRQGLKKREFILKETFSLPLPSSMLKLPKFTSDSGWLARYEFLVISEGYHVDLLICSFLVVGHCGLTKMKKWLTNSQFELREARALRQTSSRRLQALVGEQAQRKTQPTPESHHRITCVTEVI